MAEGVVEPGVALVTAVSDERRTGSNVHEVVVDLGLDERELARVGQDVESQSREKGRKIGSTRDKERGVRKKTRYVVQAV